MITPIIALSSFIGFVSLLAWIVYVPKQDHTK